ncbi:MAG: hypothetical protein JWP44_5004 [Mucilaginibacter sp.]|nr:hypothetical protein [Mucilaginibacter sp.]
MNGKAAKFLRSQSADKVVRKRLKKEWKTLDSIEKGKRTSA